MKSAYEQVVGTADAGDKGAGSRRPQSKWSRLWNKEIRMQMDSGADDHDVGEIVFGRNMDDSLQVPISIPFGKKLYSLCLLDEIMPELEIQSHEWTNSI